MLRSEALARPSAGVAELVHGITIPPAGADLRPVPFFTVIDLPKLGYVCGQVVQVQRGTFYPAGALPRCLPSRNSLVLSDIRQRTRRGSYLAVENLAKKHVDLA